MNDLLYSIQQISDQLKLPIYLVGGTIRDYLLGREVNDFDLLVLGKAGNLACTFAQSCGGTFFVLDEERGVYRVILKNSAFLNQFDFAGCPQSSLEENLIERDFTINAMALSLKDSFLPNWEDKIIDPLGGKKDLAQRLIRAATAACFENDPLRVLRCVRFAFQYRLEIGKETIGMIQTIDEKSVQSVARERIREELMQILSLPDSHRAIICLDRNLKVLNLFFPEIEQMKGVEQGPYHSLDVWDHCLETLVNFEKDIRNIDSLFPDSAKWLKEYLSSKPSGHYSNLVLLKFICLFHDLGKPWVVTKRNGRISFIGHDGAGKKLIGELAQRLRFSRKEINLFSTLVDFHMRPLELAKSEQITKKAVHRFYRELDRDGLGVLLIALADKQSSQGPLTTQSFLNYFYSMVEQLIIIYFTQREEILPLPLLTPSDLRDKLGIPPGPKYRQIIRLLLEEQVAGKVKNRQEAQEWVLKYFKKNQTT